MKKSIFSLMIFSFLIFSVNELISQPNPRMKERIKTMKKIKLMDYLDLDEETELKFLVKYNELEGKMEDAIEKLDKIEAKLSDAIEENDESSIKQLTEAFIKQREVLVQIDKQKLEMAREMLNEKEFAKFVIFEKRFREELTKHIMKRRRKPGF